MTAMRFGAILMNPAGEYGFYLSHRVVLTVPAPGSVRAVGAADFAADRVFARDGVAISFLPQLLAAAESHACFENSLAMMTFFLALPENSDGEALYKYIEQKRGGHMEECSVSKADPSAGDQGRSNNEERNNMAVNSDYNPKEDFNRKFAEARKQFKRPNILVCGYTGSGKSSLLRAVLGDIVPEDAIGAGKPKTMGYDCYENDLVRVWDSKGLELGETESEFTEETRRFIRERQNDSNVDNHIHLVWYTILGPEARVTECDKNLIRRIFNPDNVIVVITKDDVTQPAQRQALRDKLMEAGVPIGRILFASGEEGGARGCKELMALSYSMLPEAYKDAFMDAQRVDREAKIEAVYRKETKARAIIGTAVATASGVGAVPIPFSDAALLVPLQVGMIASLAGLYGLQEEAIKQSALPFVAKLVGVFTATTLLKLIPGLGNAVNAAVAGTLTGAMGLFVKKNFIESAIAKIEGRPEPPLKFDIELFKTFLNEYKKHGGKMI
ncbi:MAG: hypothetical protein GX945_16000 [Lentisphaerae bacterium]|nr:hypothetical protein [Lentisphaerota bacterium]